ncbi:helix-turn-helix domain-containing protein [Streptomyces inusitatus]|nr:helix-turn-helix domain-containing protein [Streptomyces inusitatus]
MAGQEVPASASASAELSDLLRTRRAGLRLSLRAVEERGGVNPADGKLWIKYSWIDRMEKGLATAPPTLDQLRAFATALEIPLSALKDAAGAQFFGIESVHDDDGDVRLMLGHYRELDADDRAKMLEIVRAFKKRR